MTDPKSPISITPTYLIHKTSMLLQVNLSSRMKKFNLTNLQFATVKTLYESKGSMTQSELAVEMFRSEPELKLIVDKLEKNGFVVRSNSQYDKRKKDVTLTEKAYLIYDEIINEYGCYLETVLDNIPNEQVQGLVHCLNHICKNAQKSK